MSCSETIYHFNFPIFTEFNMDFKCQRKSGAIKVDKIQKHTHTHTLGVRRQ